MTRLNRHRRGQEPAAVEAGRTPGSQTAHRSGSRGMSPWALLAHLRASRLGLRNGLRLIYCRLVRVVGPFVVNGCLACPLAD
jgi:hypothetical protein